MVDEEYQVSRYDEALSLLPYNIRERARKVVRGDRRVAEEFRLRVGWPPTVLLPDGEISLGGNAVTKEDINAVVEITTGASAYSSAIQIRNGYLTARGGYRIGLAGSVFTDDGKMKGFGNFSSLSIRISREIIGSADVVIGELLNGGEFKSTLIIAPPGAGKTTLLRDIVRQLSEGSVDRQGLRVSLADERGEVAAITDGMPQMKVGRRTDILDACPKAQAVMIMLRSMNPQVIALDEITAPEDIRSIESARNCGVELLATAHATGIEDLARRPLYRGLLQDKIFSNFVIIRRNRGRREYVVTKEDVL